MQIIFLGTAGSFPTVSRNLPSIAIRRKGEIFLFDCGEGTQRQIFRAKLGFCNKIFITHLHGDHIFGLPGLLQTMSLFGIKSSIKIFGPEGINNFINKIKEFVKFELAFPLEIEEIDEGIIYEDKEYTIHSSRVVHNIPSLAYAIIEKERPGKFYPEKAVSQGVPKGSLWSLLQHGNKIKLADGRIISPKNVLGSPRPGRKIVYSGDTKPCDSIIKLAKDADLLIYEATFDDELMEKANESGHSTPSQAAEIAKKANVKRLIMTHISARYTEPEMLIQQAQKIWPKAELAEDLMKIEIPYLQ